MKKEYLVPEMEILELKYCKMLCARVTNLHTVVLVTMRRNQTNLSQRK